MRATDAAASGDNDGDESEDMQLFFNHIAQSLDDLAPAPDELQHANSAACMPSVAAAVAAASAGGKADGKVAGQPPALDVNDLQLGLPKPMWQTRAALTPWDFGADLVRFVQIVCEQLIGMSKTYVLRLILDPAHRSLVVSKNDKIIGGVVFRPCVTQCFVEIALVAMDTPYQRHGYGRKLMQRMKEIARGWDFGGGATNDPREGPVMQAILVYADKDAVQFFRRMGFAAPTLPRSMYIDYLKETLNAELMQLTIPPPRVQPYVGVLNRHRTAAANVLPHPHRVGSNTVDAPEAVAASDKDEKQPARNAAAAPAAAPAPAAEVPSPDIRDDASDSDYEPSPSPSPAPSPRAAAAAPSRKRVRRA